MPRHALLALLFVVLAPLPVQASALSGFGPFGPAKVAYTADSRVSAQGQTLDSKVYVDGERERREMAARGMTQIVLLDRARKTATMLMPSQRMAMDMNLAKLAGPEAGEDIAWSTKAMGSETIAGVATTRHRIDGRNKKGETITGVVWMTRDNIPMKADLEIAQNGQKSRVVQELRNLRVGPLDPALFVVPAGFQRVQMPNVPAGMIPGQPKR